LRNLLERELQRYKDRLAHAGLVPMRITIEGGLPGVAVAPFVRGAIVIEGGLPDLKWEKQHAPV
jgi:hypothetical protein